MTDGEEWIRTVGPSRCLWVTPSSLHYVAFQGWFIDHIQKLQRWGTPSIRYHVWLWYQTQHKMANSRSESGEPNITLIIGAFIFISKGKETNWHLVAWGWNSTNPYISVPTHVLVQESRRDLKVTEDERKKSHVAKYRSSERGTLGSLSVLFLCEERAVERERKLTSGCRVNLVVL